MSEESPSGAGDRARGDTLGLRLALAFLGVAVAAIVLMAVLTGFLSARDVSSLADRQQSQLAGAAAVSAGSAWEHSGSWTSADLAPVLGFAQGIGIALQIRDTEGHVVAATRGFIIKEHALVLYGQCQREQCPHRNPALPSDPASPAHGRGRGP